MYNNQYANETFWIVYLIFGIGCIVFFFFGVCALLCCCRSRFRGMERKGYIIRDIEPGQQPLLPPGMSGGNPTMIVTGSYPAHPSQFSPAVSYPHNPAQAPPPYDTPVKY